MAVGSLRLSAARVCSAPADAAAAGLSAAARRRRRRRRRTRHAGHGGGTSAPWPTTAVVAHPPEFRKLRGEGGGAGGRRGAEGELSVGRCAAACAGTAGARPGGRGREGRRVGAVRRRVHEPPLLVRAPRTPVAGLVGWFRPPRPTVRVGGGVGRGGSRTVPRRSGRVRQARPRAGRGRWEGRLVLDGPRSTATGRLLLLRRDLRLTGSVPTPPHRDRQGLSAAALLQPCKWCRGRGRSSRVGQLRANAGTAAAGGVSAAGLRLLPFRPARLPLCTWT